MSRNKRPWAFSSYERFALAVGVLLLATIACFLASKALDSRASLSERIPMALRDDR